MNGKSCQHCEKQFKPKHFNEKYCPKCVKGGWNKVRGNLTPAQERIALKWSGKIYAREVADKVGVSLPTIKRWARRKGVDMDALRYKEDVIEAVCRYYEKHGKPATQKKFPNVSVRSIVERHKRFSPRCVKWTDKQIAEAVRMGGLVTFEDQAKYFNRPRANAGSVQSFWMKKFGFAGGQMNGMSDYRARLFVKASCPRVRTKFWESRRKDQVFSRKLCLWVDMEKHLRSDCPKFVAEAVKAMAEFQRWLFQSNQPKRKIMKIVRERSL